MAQKTMDEWADDLAELAEIAGKYGSLPVGPARNMLHMLFFGLERLAAEAEKGRSNRAAVRRCRARQRAAQQAPAEPLPFEE